VSATSVVASLVVSSTLRIRYGAMAMLALAEAQVALIEFVGCVVWLVDLVPARATKRRVQLRD